MTVSVVVPAFNEERVLAASLASIRAAAAAFVARGWAWELIVCDNNSTDATAAIATASGAQVVFEPINQIGRARNAGAARASGDWLVFVDADSHVSQALFEDVATEIARGTCLAGGATVTFDVADWRARIGARAWNAVSRINRWAAGAFMFCEAATFRAAGGFDHELFAAEEVDLYRRLKRLARRSGRSVVILTAHPIVTSSRKLHLYRWHEMLPFMLRSIFLPRRTLRSAENCFAWYDGRR